MVGAKRSSQEMHESAGDGTESLVEVQSEEVADQYSHLNRIFDLDNAEGIAGLSVDSEDDFGTTNNNPSDAAARMDHEPPLVVGRLPIPLYLSCNDDFLSPYQCLVRKLIELFEASSAEDIASNTQGRKRPIALGQVGIRCRHCAMHRNKSTSDGIRGAILYPSQLIGVYQAAQTMANVHLLQQCTTIPDDIKKTLLRLKEETQYSPSTPKSTVGKEAWAEMTKKLGVYEDSHGLRFSKHFGYSI